MTETELDVRPLRKRDKHPTVFAAYDRLAVGSSLELINNHDPKHLHDEFETDYPGGYRWDYLDRGPEVWRIRITKSVSTPLPRILTDTTITGNEPDATGAVWKIQIRERDLDANIIHLAPHAIIDAHAGPDVDVLIHVVHGDGVLTTEANTLEVRRGALVWLPRRSKRKFIAGPGGLAYLTVHQRRHALSLSPAGRTADQRSRSAHRREG